LKKLNVELGSICSFVEYWWFKCFNLWSCFLYISFKL